MKTKEEIEERLQDLEKTKKMIDDDLDDDTPIATSSELLANRIKILKWVLDYDNKS